MRTINGVAVPGQQRRFVRYRTCVLCGATYRVNHTCPMETPEWQRKQALEQRLREARESNKRGKISADNRTPPAGAGNTGQGLTKAIRLEGDCNG